MQAAAPSWSMGRRCERVSRIDLTGCKHHPKTPPDGRVWRMSLAQLERFPSLYCGAGLGWMPNSGQWIRTPGFLAGDAHSRKPRKRKEKEEKEKRRERKEEKEKKRKKKKKTAALQLLPAAALRRTAGCQAGLWGRAPTLRRVNLRRNLADLVGRGAAL